MVKAKVKTTGITTKSTKSLLIHSGAIYKNLSYDADGWYGEALGATQGGNKITFELDYREIELDGAFSKYVGQKVLMASNATLEASVAEITAENVRLAMNGTITKGDGTTAPATYDVIEGKGKVEASDYLINIGLVGELTGSNDPVIIILDNALCTSGLDFDTSDNAEAVINLVFEAHAHPTDLENRKLPARIYMPSTQA